jgi:hypothetical protein
MSAFMSPAFSSAGNSANIPETPDGSGGGGSGGSGGPKAPTSILSALFAKKPKDTGSAAEEDNDDDDGDGFCEILQADDAILTALQNDPSWDGTLPPEHATAAGGRTKTSTRVKLPSMLGKSQFAPTPNRCVYASVGRQKPMTTGAVALSESFTDEVPLIAVELGRKMMARKAPPGWDDITCEGWRAIKLPVHDLNGATGYTIVFGGDYDPKRAQSIVERFALMIGPMVSGELLEVGAPALSKAEVAAADAARQDPEKVLALHRSMEPVIRRELASANSTEQIDMVNDQIEMVRKIMEVLACFHGCAAALFLSFAITEFAVFFPQQNVELILDRQEQMESLEKKSSDLEAASKVFRKNTRTLRRWHLMNQVKWGVTIGTLISVAVAIPIIIIVAH